MRQCAARPGGAQTRIVAAPRCGVGAAPLAVIGAVPVLRSLVLRLLRLAVGLRLRRLRLALQLRQREPQQALGCRHRVLLLVRQLQVLQREILQLLDLRAQPRDLRAVALVGVGRHSCGRRPLLLSRVLDQ